MRVLSWLSADVGETARKFWSWWKNELASLTPASVRRSWDTDREVLEIKVVGDLTEVRRLSKRVATAEHSVVSVDFGTTADIGLRAARAGSTRSAKTVLILPSSCAMSVDRWLPLKAIANARDALELEVLSGGPFDRSEVYLATTIGEQKENLVRATLSVVKRSSVDPLIEDLVSHGVPVHAVYAEAGPSERNSSGNLIAGTAIRSPAHDDRLRSVIGALIVCAAVLLLALGYVSYARYSLARADLEHRLTTTRQRIQMLVKSVESVETDVHRSAQLKMAKATSVPIVAVWEEISRLLPDSAWITGLRTDDNVLVLDGAAPAAADLVSVFSHSNVFARTELSSQVTRDERLGAERFQLRLRISRSSERKQELSLPAGK